MIERKNYAALAAPVGPYVHAVKHQNLLFLSGLTAFGTPAESKSIAQQTEAIFQQIQVIAHAEQTELSALIKVTLFVTELTHINEMREVLFQIYGKHLPASSLVQVQQLFSPTIQVEIEAILSV